MIWSTREIPRTTRKRIWNQFGHNLSLFLPRFSLTVALKGPPSVMPEISGFLGVVISMYFDEPKFGA
jgi:hypothetical protein